VYKFVSGNEITPNTNEAMQIVKPSNLSNCS
jgi:hypothetical protein